MLRVRPHTSIFQQIILPHLSTTVPVQRAVTERAGRRNGQRDQQYTRSFTSSISRSCPPETAGDVSYHRNATWEPYTPTASTSTSASESRLRTREYLGLGDSDRGRIHGGRLDDNVDRETYRKTTALALERIIRSHEPPPTSTSTLMLKRDKGKQVERDPRAAGNIESAILATGIDFSGDVVEPRALPDTQKSSQINDLNHDHFVEDDRPFPPLIHQLLQARQFRLTTLHILNSSSYALDTALKERVAGYMDRHHGQNAARRLRKGRIPSPEEVSLMTEGPGSQDEVSPIARVFGPIPPNSYSNMDEHTPAIELSRQERITAFHNTQLAHQLSSSYLPKGLIPPKSLPRPNTSLRQLRSLLARINKLESCRGFVPDRVTANIVLGCWVRCALAPQPDGVRVVLTTAPDRRRDSVTDYDKDKRWKISPRHVSMNRQFGGEELGKLFELVSRLFDRAAGISDLSPSPSPSHSRLTTSPTLESATDTVTTSQSANTPNISTGIEPRQNGSDANVDANVDVDLNRSRSRADATPRVHHDPGLDYSRHVKPFIKIFQHGYKRRKDLAGLEKLRDWDLRIRAVLSERQERRHSDRRRDGGDALPVSKAEDPDGNLQKVYKLKVELH